MDKRTFIALVFICGIVYTCGTSYSTWAQQPTTESEAATASAVAKLDSVMTHMATYVKPLQAYQVDVESHWQLDGPRAAEGTNHYTLTVRQPDQFRLEVLSREPAKPTLICVSDGQTLTRMFTANNETLYSQGPGSLGQLADDAMTTSALQGSGLDLICRADLHDFVMAMTSNVQFLGEEDLEGTAALHFRSGWNHIPTIEFWISAGDQPVLRQTARTMDITTDGAEPVKLTITTKLTWKDLPPVQDEMFAAHLPSDAVQVHDLQTYLLEGGTRELLGQLAPTVDLTQLNGAPWKLQQHVGKQVVVLFFWASWAAPSTQDMPQLLKFIEQQQDKAVAFYAINVGETADQVRPFIESQGYTSPVVLDFQQAASRAFRVTSLPACVLIGRDGTIQAVHVGASTEAQEGISRDLNQLLAGETVAP